MSHSFVFIGPVDGCPDPYAVIRRKEFVEFLTWHQIIDSTGLCVIGYVQFLFKRTAESLHENFQFLKFVPSVNDAAVYSHFLVPRMCHTSPVTHGTPRVKSYVMEQGLFVLKSWKKKAQQALNRCSPKQALIDASLALLQGYAKPL